MAIQQIYVDPSIAGASGAGTVGDPYGDIQHALDTMTRDAANGDQLNIKAGTDEILAAALDLTTYGTPTAAAPLIFRGYTTAAGDGGIGGISGAGSNTIIGPATLDYILFCDMHLHNTGANDVIILNTICWLINCEIDNSSTGGIDMDNDSTVIGCHVHNVGGVAIKVSYSSIVSHNYIEDAGANSMTSGIDAGWTNGSFDFNVLTMKAGATAGIYLPGVGNVCRNNTVYSASGTGIGIHSASALATVTNNYVEGFSGAGGDGYSIASTGAFYVSNRWFNCTTGETVAANTILDDDNSAVSASALIDPTNGDFRPNGDLRAGAWPSTFPETGTPNYLDIGAVQRKEPLPIWARRQARH